MFSIFNSKKKPVISTSNKSSVVSELHATRKQLDAVMEINKAMAGVLDINEVLKLITNKLVSVIDVSYAVIFAWDEQNQKINVRSITLPSFAKTLIERALGKSIEEVSLSAKDPEQKKNDYIKCLMEERILLTKNLSDNAYPFISKGLSETLQPILGMKLAVSIPLIMRGKKLGVLGLIWREEVLSEEQNQLMLTFADQISATIFNARLFDQVHTQVNQLESQNKDLASLFNLSTQISKTLDPKQVAQNAVNSLPQNEFMVGGMILNYDPTESQVWVTAVTQNALSEKVMGVMGDFSQYKTKLDDPKAQKSPVIQAAKTETLAYTNELNDVLYPLPKRIADAAAKLINIRSVVAYPIKTQGKTIGVVAYFLKDKGYDEVEDNKKQLISTYTLQINIALENAYLYAESQATRQHLEDALYQLKEARRLEKDMIDVMGHELRTPISIVRNALVMVEKQMERQRQIESSELHKYMDMALESTRREITLIETLLSATKVDAARMQLYFTKVDLKDVINDGIEGQKAQLEKKKEVQVTYTPPAEDIFVFADRTRMQEIMDNLYSNAVKYTLKGNITIRAWQDKDYGWISIADQGIGISAEDLQNLGKKFFRARQYVNDGGEVEDTEIVRPGGTGLGLYVTYDLVRIMGGTLYINSEIGKGSTFTVSIPLFKNQADKQVDETFDIEDKSKHTHVLINKTLPQPPQA